MPFDLPVGYKFSCFAVEGVSREGRRDPLDLGDGPWVVFEPPFELSEAWEDWLGEIQIKNLKQCNLGLLAISPSVNPGVLDNEKQRTGLMGCRFLPSRCSRMARPSSTLTKLLQHRELAPMRR